MKPETDAALARLDRIAPVVSNTLLAERTRLRGLARERGEWYALDVATDDLAKCRAALAAVDADARAIRRAALEEAAKACEDEAEWAGANEFSISWQESAEACAARIRALGADEEGR